jgi:hypothetical protein
MGTWQSRQLGSSQQLYTEQHHCAVRPSVSHAYMLSKLAMETTKTMYTGHYHPGQRHALPEHSMIHHAKLTAAPSKQTLKQCENPDGSPDPFW